MDKFILWLLEEAKSSKSVLVDSFKTLDNFPLDLGNLKEGHVQYISQESLNTDYSSSSDELRHLSGLVRRLSTRPHRKPNAITKYLQNNRKKHHEYIIMNSQEPIFSMENALIPQPNASQQDVKIINDTTDFPTFPDNTEGKRNSFDIMEQGPDDPLVYADKNVINTYRSSLSNKANNISRNDQLRLSNKSSKKETKNPIKKWIRHEKEMIKQALRPRSMTPDRQHYLNEFKVNHFKEVSNTNTQFYDTIHITKDATEVCDEKHQQEELAQSLTIYHLTININSGEQLAIKDIIGTSDPYVKVKLGTVTVYRTKTIKENLNPIWDEKVIIPIETIEEANEVKFMVFDYDRTTQDDFIGAACIDCSNIELNRTYHYQLELKYHNRGKDEIGGYLNVSTILSQHVLDEKDSRIISLRRQAQRKMVNLIWTSTLTFVVLEGKNFKPLGPTKDVSATLDPFQDNDPTKSIKSISSLTDLTTFNATTIPCPPFNLYCKMNLGPERAKTKVKYNADIPHWRERFIFHLYMKESQVMTVSVFNKTLSKPSPCIGKIKIDLAEIPLDVNTTFWRDIESETHTGTIKFMVVISGCQAKDQTSDQNGGPPLMHGITSLAQIEETYYAENKKKLFDLSHVGYLIVKVLKAKDLTAVDIGGSSDPFCILELVNTRLQTHTIYKNVAPEWNKTFVFEIHDLFTTLDVVVMDENKNHKLKFIGKISIPLISVQNGEPIWYKLRNQSLTTEVKGEILLEIVIVYNLLKAMIVTFRPREEKIIPESVHFSKTTFLHNIDRLRRLWLDPLVVIQNILSDILNWTNPKWSTLSLAGYILLVYYFQPYMIPLGIIGIFGFAHWYEQKYNAFTNVNIPPPQTCIITSDVEDLDDEYTAQITPMPNHATKKEATKSAPKTLKSTINLVQDTCLMLQTLTDKIASFGERGKNIFNFSCPILSCFALLLLLLVTLVLYFVPLRWILMIWGINKFTKKLRAPLSISHNELYDFVSRFPTDKEKDQLEMFKDQLELFKDQLELFKDQLELFKDQLELLKDTLEAYINAFDASKSEENGINREQSRSTKYSPFSKHMNPFYNAFNIKRSNIISTEHS